MKRLTAWVKTVDNVGQMSYPQIGHNAHGGLTTGKK